MKPKLACITLDMEPDHADSQKRIQLLENPQYSDRFVEIVNRHNAKVTMFTVASLFETRGDDFKRLASQIPLEYAVHSYSHDPHNACSLDEVKRSAEAFYTFTGQPPLGYRAPIGQINKDGLGHLLDHGFAYDASVYSSVRPGEFGYFNLHLPNIPFRVRRGADSLVEFPFTSVSTVRVPFALSYARLLGWGIYSALLNIFGLPEVALLLCHPYNFYFRLSDGIERSPENFALARNSGRSFDYFAKMIETLERQGYQFLFLSEIYEQVKDTNLQELAWEAWK
ncbi:MAG: polysaccharide deacetylase family protein [Chloroflexota bacterium]